MILMAEKLLTSKEVLDILSIGKTKLFQLIKEGILKPVSIGEKRLGAKRGPSLKFKKSDIDELMK